MSNYPKEFFDFCMYMIKAIEKGLVDDKDDPGGLTKYGLSQEEYPDLDIRNLTIEQALDIYYNDFWLKGKCSEMPRPVCWFHFDTCVNCGIPRAGFLIQRAILACGKYVKLDGIVGSKTLFALSLCDPIQILRHYASKRNLFYHSLVKRKKKLGKYLHGWFDRVSRVMIYCLTDGECRL